MTVPGFSSGPIVIRTTDDLIEADTQFKEIHKKFSRSPYFSLIESKGIIPFFLTIDNNTKEDYEATTEKWDNVAVRITLLAEVKNHNILTIVTKLQTAFDLTLYSITIEPYHSKFSPCILKDKDICEGNIPTDVSCKFIIEFQGHARPLSKL